MALNSKQQMFWTNEKRKLSDLKPWQRNPRQIKDKHAKLLAESFSDFGQVETIAISANGDIYNGHQRLSVLAGKYGMDYEVDVRVSSRDLTEKERERLTVYLHRGATGEWNFDELANWDMSDLLTWGFEESDFPFDVAPATNEGADAEPQVDKAEELRQKWNVQSGQMWQLGEHRIICGDCTDRAVVERVMSGEKADLAWFDPPFGINLKPQRQKTEAIENDGKEDAQLLWCNFLPILKENMILDTHLFLCQGWSEFDWTLPLVRKHFTIKSKVVWNKNVWGIGYYTRPKHEDILYCWYGEPPTIDVPVADVWDIARENAPIHAAEKPPELSSIAIAHFSKKRNVVIDWFSGVGGTIIACENLSRKCRAVEISPAYVAVAIQRWVDVTGKKPILLDA